jgi:hypothetical protein
MLFKKDEKTPDEFWREYEEKTGEKVLTRGLGKYVSGWDEFDKKRWNGLWGLVINTSGGFRFHHFPQNSFFDALINLAANDKEQQKEKTIFLPREKIISQDFIKEEKWYKKLFFNSTPRLVINYIDESSDKSVEKSADIYGKEGKKLVFEAEYTM